MSKHTPGPWAIRDDDENGVVSIVGSSRIVLARVRTATVEPGDENARLISAAPELLEIAESILADDMIQYLPNEYVAKVRAVINKAVAK